MTAPADIQYRNESVTVYGGDCLDILKTLPDNSVHAIITDPPYGLDFMGKHWDTGAVAFDTTVWAHCLRVLKPGGHLLAFGGTRTWHRLACAIEDAGFEIRDSIAWLYGSGFPKSLDVSKAIDRAAGVEREVVGPSDRHGGGSNVAVADFDRYGKAGDVITAPATDAARAWQGWGTALKPAFEPVVVARKPLIGTVAANVQAHGTGALNIDGCRISVSDADRAAVQGREWVADNLDRTAYGKFDGDGKRRAIDYAPAGRWPTNVVLDEHAAAELDKQSGTLTSGKISPHHKINQKSEIYSKYSPVTGLESYGDSGGASRFFPTFHYTPKAPGTERPTADGIAHPTVKPLDLMRWLIRLVTPPGGTVLDPFAGTGTTGEAAIHEHMRAILIEREADYLPLIVARIHKPMHIGFDLSGLW